MKILKFTFFKNKNKIIIKFKLKLKRNKIIKQIKYNNPLTINLK